MGISQYIRVIGRGQEGARALTREQAADLFGQVLDGSVSDLEVGGFCLAMRIKGETPEEMAGFLDATQSRLTHVTAQAPVVVLPSYNGARKLPGLLPLLALLLARENLAVLLHGTATETNRIYTADVLARLGVTPAQSIKPIAPGEIQFVPTGLLCNGLHRLLEVRRVIGLRNPAHSLVKLMNPVAGPALIVSSYTHPEYAESMARTFELVRANALLLRGTEGEPVADARRLPAMQGFIGGQSELLQNAQSGSLLTLPDLPSGNDADSSAHYIRAVLTGKSDIPAPIAIQVERILHLIRQL